jgi:O-acetyl-ADP-ribose deacetylase (regulator of RNase III)
MKLVLTAVEKSLADAWQKFCGDLDFVTVHQGSILDVECDAVVSPANSFGFMDGGIDAVYLRHFGYDIQTRVRQQIYEHHHGRVPMILQDTVNPYLAARAIFTLVKHKTFLSGSLKGKPISEHIKTIALPGLGTGVGRVGFNTCAHQVRKAIDDILLENYTMPQSWAEASERHQLLYTDKLKRLQY